MIIVALIISIAMASIAGYFSIVGLMTIYSSAAFGIMIAGIAIELSKVVTVSFLYTYWNVMDNIKRMIAFMVIIGTMTITSIGVYGYLSKGYLDQVAPMQGYEIQIQNLDFQTSTLQQKVDANQKQLDILDDALERYISLGAISKGLEKIEERQGRIDELRDSNTELRNQMADLEAQKLEYRQKMQHIDNEIGIIGFIASMFMDDSEESRETALRIFTLILVLLLDPTAIALLWFANHAYHHKDHEDVRTDLKSGLLNKDSNVKHTPYRAANDVPEDVRQEIDNFLAEKGYDNNDSLSHETTQEVIDNIEETQEKQPSTNTHWVKSRNS